MTGPLADVLEEHAETAAFLYDVRVAMVASRTQSLEDLTRLDDRLDAHLDGLLLAGDAGEAAARGRGGAGEAFVAAVIALRREDAAGFAAFAARGAGERVGAALRDALAWAPLADAARGARALTSARALRISALCAHRADPGELLTDALGDADPRARRAALSAIGVLGRRDLLGAALGSIDDPGEGCRARAAWAATLLGEPRAREPLVEAACRGDARAMDLGMRVGTSAEAAAILDAAAAGGRDRLALEGAAARGDAALVPWILARAERPELARLAGWAFSTVTGVDLAAEGLATAPPPGFAVGPSDDPIERDVGLDPDLRLPWPRLEAVRAFWAGRAPRDAPPPRGIMGRPIDRGSARAALAHGSQHQRASAAIELRLLGDAAPLFPVRAPAFRQARQLATLTRGAET